MVIIYIITVCIVVMELMDNTAIMDVIIMEEQLLILVHIVKVLPPDPTAGLRLSTGHLDVVRM
jgi:hypothetical protein